MSNELSLKFLINQADHARLLRQPLLRDAAVRHPEHAFSIHYDTRTLQLQRHGVELTLKRQGGSWLQAVQYGTPDANSESASEVWHAPYFNHFDFTEIDDAKLRNWLSQARVSTRIVPIFESDLRHSFWRVSMASGAIVDVTLSRGNLVSSGRREPVNDLALVLIEGTRADLYAVATQLAARITFQRQLQTLTERGGNLFQNTPASATKAEPLAFSAKALPLNAFRQIALSCLRQLQVNQTGAVTSTDPEYVHQMRVATRRLRAALQVFKPLIPPSVVEQMAQPLRDLMQILGRVRDLDVVLSEIVNPVARETPDDPSLVALSVSLTERRFRALNEVSNRLQSISFGQLQLQTEALLHSEVFDTSRPTPRATADATEKEKALVDLKDFALKRLRNLLNKVQDAASHARTDDPASLHDLRICIKRLRYALEFFRQMMPKKASANILQSLVTTQEKLGKLNDIAVAGEILLLCVAADRSLRLAVSLVASAHAQRYADLLADVAMDIKQLERLTLPRLS